jgi:hypothetical protein
MGMTKINDKPVVTPADQMRVEELKELADIPKHEKLYNPADGRVLDDGEVVPANDREYGVVPDWERGTG